MSKILANEIANYGDDAPIELKEGLSIPAGKPLQAAGAPGSNGQVLTSTGSTVQWTTPFDGDYNSLSNRPTIPAAQVNSDWNAVGSVAAILNKPVVPAVPSINTLPASGGGSLSYNSGNGEFAFTPPDLSNYDTAYGWGDHAAVGYLTSFTETDPVFSASDAAAVTAAKITNWDTSYGWGDHSTQGYITGLDMEDLGNVDIAGGLSDQQVLKWNAANSAWEPANDLVGGAQGVALTDLSVSTNPVGTAALSYNNANGVFTYTPPDLSGYLTSFTETDPVFAASPAANITLTKINQWDTAYGWGNHANGGYLVATAQDKTNWNTAFGWGDHSTQGYLTSFTETDPVFSASTAAGISGADVANWNTAYGWGDHSTAGYQLTSSNSLGGLNNVTITNPSTNDVLSYNGSGWVNASASVIAKATISDTPPGTPQNGDLWWESDTGRLKIRYNDTDSQQWVDASPPLADATSIGGSGTVAMLASLVPDTNAAYDIGTAEYKIRDLYLSQASDARLKTDVVDYTGGLEFVESLRVVDFTWKEDVAEKAGKRETGLIAQEVKEALDASNYNSWRLHTDGDTQGLDREQLIPALISAIQELSARVKELENK